MSKNLNKYLTYFLFSLTLYTFSQNPSYFILGEKTLQNKEIYSIHKNNKGILFVATDEGLYKYVNDEMLPIRMAKGQKDISIFNLKSDKLGNVYGCNLSGQIFNVKNNKLNIIYELPSPYLGSNLNIFITNDNEIIVISKGAVLLKFNSNNKKWESNILIRNRSNQLYGARNNEKISIFQAKKDSILLFHNGAVKWKKKEANFPNFDSNYRLPIYLDSILYSTSIFNDLVGVGNKHAKKYCQFNDDEVWQLDNKHGISLLCINNGKPIIKKEYFKELFISSIFESKKGDLYLGTFGKGLLVIPNRHTNSYNIGEKSNIKSITVSQQGTVYISDISVGLAAFKENKAKLLLDGDSDLSIPDKLFILSGLKTPIYNTDPDLFFNDSRFSGALKSVQLIDFNNKQYILAATSTGIQLFGQGELLNFFNWDSILNKKLTKSLSNIKERCNDVYFDVNSMTLFIAAQSGLYYQKSGDVIKEILYKKNSIIVNDLEWKKGNLWCATQNKGIIVFNNNSLVEHWNIINGLQSKFVKKIRFHKNNLFVQHRIGFQILDMKNKSWSYMGKAEGVPSSRIKDFSIGSKNIWFVGDKTLISKPLKYIKSSPFSQEVGVDSILLSRKRVFPHNKNEFPNHLNYFEVFTNSYDPFYSGELVLKYQLKGLDSIWREHNIGRINSINYGYLPAGNYSFTLKSKLRGQEKLLTKFKFKILPVFYKQWWFYLLFLLIFFGLSVVVFYSKNKREKRKASQQIKERQLKMEVAENELKALRSQMNPHFIFNSLNAIQNLILKEDIDSSYDYIVLFSQLVRNALLYSEQGSLMLSQEINFLKTYLKLEKLRFGDDFDYKIEITSSKDIRMPALFLQPFVENSIVHGLFHKDGLKKLKIKFEIFENRIHCLIEDNGIGRKASKNIQIRQNSNHQSVAIKIMKRRIEILKSKGYNFSSFSIEDMRKNDQLIGTSVSIVLPILSI